ncbi:MAG TPA: stage V sporulation protein AC [Candidatus Monoglobus merdigallinarum]|uniref:Stage V sporulation protein AC n=1 Tax=Candidatus Monoglobus merdigallinarum TaxID=2838698 RepID=A0A9D1TM75_9FIRM|nr:stage V sporulation protein AC [Candidatus Monoglobus merdigallinarum]
MSNKNSGYLNYIDKTAPKSPILKDMLMAFLFGGLICVIGQLFLELYQNVLNLDDENSKTAVSITMVFIGALLTGLDIYPKLAKHAGAGTIVPITGFANSIASPAMEFKREGLVTGMAVKMFTVAGPVLVYGISASVAVGIIYYLYKILIGG